MSKDFKVQFLYENVIIDTFVVYQFLKKLTTPFSNWEARRAGIIDDKGNILRKRSSLTAMEKNKFTLFDLMTLKMKRILEKIPGGRSKVASYAAAMYFISESSSFNEEHPLFDDENMEEMFNTYLNVYNEEDEANKLFDKLDKLYYNEDTVPTNHVGSGSIAGTDGTRVNRKPPLLKRRKTIEEI